ncbi:SDR family NAD(P)-dependent oxidoreductase [Burkholderia multivorans]|uniref:SDR family NAD(P)-dependent oxidoreductase n=1 Tax=Burkholderia multivorans TaxID=87883 RepID=UPI0004F8EC35|nr:short chain dehydrogenase family protein [Burkholderia multivorans]
MDLGIEGKTALVCAASKGLGRGCAQALAAEGVNLVIVARTRATLEETAEEIRAASNVSVTAVACDITTPEGRAAALAACPQPDILVTNAGGPPPGDFRDFSHDDWIRALEANMLTPIELIRATVDGMIARRFGRIVNITSSAVKAPIDVLALSNGARSGLTGFVAGLARKVAPHGVTINNLLPGLFDTDRIATTLAAAAKAQGARRDGRRTARAACEGNPGRPSRHARRVWRRLRVPLQRACRVYHRPELAARRRRVPRHVLTPRTPGACRTVNDNHNPEGRRIWR